MPREENKEIEEERRAKTAYDLMRIRLKRLERNIDKPVPIPQKRDEFKPKPPPEFVRNVVGSSAAAGSAEFHIFRNNKRRELERLDYIEKKALKDELDNEYEEKKRTRKEEEERKTTKKREKRLKQKERRKKARMDKRKGPVRSDQSSSSDSDDQEDEQESKKDDPKEPNKIVDDAEKEDKIEEEVEEKNRKC